VSKRNFFIISAWRARGLSLLIIFMTDATAFKGLGESSKLWNQEAIKATYVASQLKELDKTHSILTLSYDLENDTDSDYRLNAGPDVVIQSRLKSGGSLSQQEPLRLSYPVFLPARQHARLAIENDASLYLAARRRPRVRGQAPVIREAKTGKRWRIRSVRPGQPRRSQVAGGVAATPGSGARELLMSQARIENGGMPGEGSPKEEPALGRTKHV